MRGNDRDLRCSEPGAPVQQLAQGEAVRPVVRARGDAVGSGVHRQDSARASGMIGGMMSWRNRREVAPSAHGVVAHARGQPASRFSSTARSARSAPRRSTGRTSAGWIPPSPRTKTTRPPWSSNSATTTSSLARTQKAEYNQYLSLTEPVTVKLDGTVYHIEVDQPPQAP